MKQQIRKYTFETNSSTNHALVIAKKGKDLTFKDVKVGWLVDLKTVNLRILSYAEFDNLDFNKIEDRILFLYNVTLYCYDKDELVNFLYNLSRANIDYRITNEYVYHYFDFPRELAKDILDNEETFINFIFSDHVFYDTYCDECGGTLEEQEEWFDKVNEEIKKHDSIYLSYR